MNSKVDLSYEELQIILQCIYALKFDGKDVIHVGLLASKIQQELVKIEQKAQKNEQTK